MTSFITKNKNSVFYKLIILLLWIGVWQVVHIIIAKDVYVPSPLNVFLRLKELVVLSEFWESILHTIFRVAVGLLLSIIFGVTIGIISGLNKFIYQIFNPLLSAIKSTPVMSFIIIAIIWFSSYNVPIFICILMCFPIVWSNVVEGISNVDNKILEMAKVFKVSKKNILKKVYAPSIMPYFYAACFTSIGIGWKASVAAEVLSSPKMAIGSQLYNAKAYLDTEELFAWTLVIIVLSLIFESIFQNFFKKRAVQKSGPQTEKG